MPDELDSLVPEQRKDERDVRLAYYKAIIERYREYIDSSEQKTIPELKALLAKDAEVLKVSSEFKRGIGAYAYEKDFPLFARSAFSFMRDIADVRSEIGVSFWLKPKEILSLQAADSFDKAIFMCALLLAGDCPTAKVRVLEIEGGVRHPVVLAKFNEEDWLFDPAQEWNEPVRGSLSDLLSQFSLSGKRVVRSLYEFNGEEYSDLAE